MPWCLVSVTLWSARAVDPDRGVDPADAGNILLGVFVIGDTRACRHPLTFLAGAWSRSIGSWETR